MIVDLTLEAGVMCVGNFRLNDAGKPEMADLVGIFVQWQGQQVDITELCLMHKNLMDSVEHELMERCRFEMSRLSPAALKRLEMVR